MCFFKVLLQHLIIQVILHLATWISPVADMAPFMFLPTVLIEFIVTIESFATKAAFWMAPKTTLVNGPWVVISKLLMPPEFSEREKFVLVGKDLLVAGAEVTHHFAMALLHMAMQVRPS